jgi:hypothetical protein
MFLASMADFIANLVDICFGSFSASPATPVVISLAADLGSRPRKLIPKAALTSTLTKQVSEIHLATPVHDLLEKTHPPTPFDLTAGMDCIINMMAETLEIREETQAKPKLAPGPSRMPLVLRSSTNIYSSKMAKMPQIRLGRAPLRLSTWLSAHMQTPLMAFAPSIKRTTHTFGECYGLRKTVKLIEKDQLRHIARTSQFPDYGAFQDVRVIIPPNPHGKVGDLSQDRETFMVSNGKLPRDGDMDSTEVRHIYKNADRARHRQEEIATVGGAVNNTTSGNGPPLVGDALCPPPKVPQHASWSMLEIS